MQDEIMLMRIIGQVSDFLRRVQGAELRWLGNRDDFGLDMVLITHAMHMPLNLLNRDLAVWRGHSEELAPGDMLRRAAFIDIDVCRYGTEHGMIRMRCGLQSQDVGSSAAKHEKDVDILPEMFLKFGLGAPGVHIIAIADRMADIDILQRCKNIRM